MHCHSCTANQLRLSRYSPPIYFIQRFHPEIHTVLLIRSLYRHQRALAQTHLRGKPSFGTVIRLVFFSLSMIAVVGSVPLVHAHGVSSSLIPLHPRISAAFSAPALSREVPDGVICLSPLLTFLIFGMQRVCPSSYVTYARVPLPVTPGHPLCMHVLATCEITPANISCYSATGLSINSDNRHCLTSLVFRRKNFVLYLPAVVQGITYVLEFQTTVVAHYLHPF
jgi:hypothetical protein